MEGSDSRPVAAELSLPAGGALHMSPRQLDLGIE
jgi:hypothetical protein